MAKFNKIFFNITFNKSVKRVLTNSVSISFSASHYKKIKMGIFSKMKRYYAPPLRVLQL